MQFVVVRTTSEDQLKCVAHHVQGCIRRHPKLYTGAYTIWWSAAAGDQLQLSVAFDHKSSGTDELMTRIAKMHMYGAVTDAFKEHGIAASNAPDGRRAAMTFSSSNRLDGSAGNAGAHLSSSVGRQQSDAASVGNERALHASAQTLVLQP
eukprot:jgi/Ulvmu1/12076/UM083_0089.1